MNLPRAEEKRFAASASLLTSIVGLFAMVLLDSGCEPPHRGIEVLHSRAVTVSHLELVVACDGDTMTVSRHYPWYQILQAESGKPAHNNYGAPIVRRGGPLPALGPGKRLDHGLVQSWRTGGSKALHHSLNESFEDSLQIRHRRIEVNVEQLIDDEWKRLTRYALGSNFVVPAPADTVYLRLWLTEAELEYRGVEVMVGERSGAKVPCADFRLIPSKENRRVANQQIESATCEGGTVTLRFPIRAMLPWIDVWLASEGAVPSKLMIGMPAEAPSVLEYPQAEPYELAIDESEIGDYPGRSVIPEWAVEDLKARRMWSKNEARRRQAILAAEERNLNPAPD